MKGKVKKINLGDLVFRSLSTRSGTPTRVSLVDDHWVYIARYLTPCSEKTSAKDLFLLVLEGELSLESGIESLQLERGEGAFISAETLWQPLPGDKGAVVLHFEARCQEGEEDEASDLHVM